MRRATSYSARKDKAVRLKQTSIPYSWAIKEKIMLWITIKTNRENEYLDAVNFLIQENGTYNIILMDGTSRKGFVKNITFLHIESVPEY